MISIIIPVYNEEKNIPDLITQLFQVFENLKCEYEIIFVDDGSTDGSRKSLSEYSKDSKHLKVVFLSRNFGQQAAYTAGMRHSSGDIIVLMDGDLQDPPTLIPSFIEKIDSGYDVVYAVRLNRQENILKRASYFIFYRVLKFITPFDIPLDSGDFGAITRRVADHLNTMPEKNRFLRGLRSYVGFKQIAISYKRKNRISGEPKYNFFKLLGLASDGIFGFSLLPLRLATISGFFVSFLAILYGIKVIAWRLTSDDELPGWATLATALTFLGGLNLLFLGIIGEYIGRIFAQVNSRPEYIVSDKLNLD
jgi:glycosyltransferase involved in cell wall biosynthesis